MPQSDNEAPWYHSVTWDWQQSSSYPYPFDGDVREVDGEITVFDPNVRDEDSGYDICVISGSYENGPNGRKYSQSALDHAALIAAAPSTAKDRDELILERNGMADILQQQAAESLIAVTALKAENAKLREALSKIANHEVIRYDRDQDCTIAVDSNPDDLQDIARAALTETETGR